MGEAATAQCVRARVRSDGHIGADLFISALSAYPTGIVKGPAPLPAWIATYDAAKAAGLIPGFAPSVMGNGNPTYPAGANVTDICSWTLSHCFEAFDVVDAPTGMCGVHFRPAGGFLADLSIVCNSVGIAFDDGPQPASPPLYQFLQAQSTHARTEGGSPCVDADLPPAPEQAATHFMIGANIRDNPSIFQQAVSSGGHIAIRSLNFEMEASSSLTESPALIHRHLEWVFSIPSVVWLADCAPGHPYMTTMTDMQILGEIGWTAQIIFDQSGLVPAFWRPPCAQFFPLRRDKVDSC